MTMAKEPTFWGAAVTRVAGSKLVMASGNGAIVLQGGVGEKPLEWARKPKGSTWKVGAANTVPG